MTLCQLLWPHWPRCDQWPGPSTWHWPWMVSSDSTGPSLPPDTSQRTQTFNMKEVVETFLILRRGLSFNYKIRKSRSESKLIFNMSNKFYGIQKWYPSLILHLSFFKLRFCSWIFCHESKTKWPIFQVLLRITWQLLNFYLHHLLAKVDIQ